MGTFSNLAASTSAVELQKMNRRAKRAEKREKEAEKREKAAHKELGPRVDALEGALQEAQGGNGQLESALFEAQGRIGQLESALFEAQGRIGRLERIVTTQAAAPSPDLPERRDGVQ